MTTYNTGNPIGSTDSRDRLDNTENFDVALNTLDPTWEDRFGRTRDSFEGALSKLSFYRVGTFAAGYTLTNMRQTLEYSGHEYSWAGTFPKVVAAGATPATSGGISAGSWVDRTDYYLRDELLSLSGAGIVITSTGNSVQEELNNLTENISSVNSTLKSEIDSLADGQQSGVIVFQTYALLDAYTPANTTEQKGSFKVVNDPTSSLNGYYSWVSGTAYVKDASLVSNTISSTNTSDAVSGAAVYKSESPLYDVLQYSSSLFSGAINSLTTSVNSGLTWIEPTPASDSTKINRVKFSVRSGESNVDVRVKVYSKNTSNVFTLVKSISLGLFQPGTHSVNVDIDIAAGQYIGFYSIGKLNYGTESGTSGYYVYNGELTSATISSLLYPNTRVSIEYHKGSISNLATAISDLSDVMNDLADDYTFFKGSSTIIESGGSTANYAEWILNSPSSRDALLTRFTIADVKTDNIKLSIRVYTKDATAEYFTPVREKTFFVNAGTNVLYLEMPVYEGEYLGIYGGSFGYNAAGGVTQSIYSRSSALSVGTSGIFTGPNSFYFPWKFEVGGDVISPVRLDVAAAVEDIKYINKTLLSNNLKTNYDNLAIDYEINQFPCYGQSLSVGQARPVISTAQNYDNLMFYRGMIPQYEYSGESAATWYSSLVPAVETAGVVNTGLNETPNTATGDMIKQLINSESLSGVTYSYKMLLSSPGYGSTTIAQLSKGTAHYNRMVDQFTYGRSLAYSSNQSYKARGCSWVQGESDYISRTTRSAYLSSLKALLSDLKTDIDADFKMISYQLSSHYEYSNGNPTIALAQSDMEAYSDDFIIACPMYHLKYADSLHLTGESSRVLGGYIGIAYKRTFVDGVKFKPLTIKSHNIVNGNQIHLKFNVPSGVIAVDTNIVPEASGYGFEVSNNTITSVSVTGPDSIKIVLASSLSGGETLKYAATGSGSNGTDFRPRGNIRDTQGDDIVFYSNGYPYKMHNWLLISEIAL